MSSQFQKVEFPSVFSKRISKVLNARILQLNKDNPDYARNLIFTENIVAFPKKKWKASPKPIRIQRKLLNSILYDLSQMITGDSTLLDVASSGKRYGRFLGLEDKNIYPLDIAMSAETAYVDDIEGPCQEVPRNYFDTALCLNYLLLAKSPYKVIENISSFLKQNGIAIFDFASLNYWYLAHDGRQWYSYTPSFIADVMGNNFSEFIVVPVGNFFQAAMNYYEKKYRSRFTTYLLKVFSALVGSFERYPSSAITYLIVAIK